jgi:hypothetical protein
VARISTLLAALALWCGCGGEDAPAPARSGAHTSATPEPPERPRPEPALERARCPQSLAGCVEATGTVVYVERVDLDGDGDAHFVLLGRDGVTAPGITVVDVRRDLRPDPLPGPGDALSAAGPVFPGSFGQRQIEAVAVSAAH